MINILNNTKEFREAKEGDNLHDKKKIEEIQKCLDTVTNIDLWNNQTLFYNNTIDSAANQIEIQIIDETNQNKIWEVIFIINKEKNEANLIHRLVEKNSKLKWFELLQIMEYKLKEYGIKRITMECSQIEIVERWKRQWFSINETSSNQLTKEYFEKPENFTVYDFNIWHKLKNVSIKKDILQEILFIKLERNDSNQYITLHDLEEYCDKKNIEYNHYIWDRIKQICPRFYMTKDL